MRYMLHSVFNIFLYPLYIRQHLIIQRIADYAAWSQDLMKALQCFKALVNLVLDLILMSVCDIHAPQSAHQTFACHEKCFVQLRESLTGMPVEYGYRIIF